MEGFQGLQGLQGLQVLGSGREFVSGPRPATVLVPLPLDQLLSSTPLICVVVHQLPLQRLESLLTNFPVNSVTLFTPEDLLFLRALLLAELCLYFSIGRCFGPILIFHLLGLCAYLAFPAKHLMKIVMSFVS